MNAAGSERQVVFVDLNLLPEELRPRGYPLMLVLLAVLLVLAMVGLASLYRAERSAADETARLRHELELMDSDLLAAQVDMRKKGELRRQLEAAEASIAALAAERDAVLGDGIVLAEDLPVLSSSAPAGLTLQTASGDGVQTTLTGQAATTRDILDYARALERSGRFAEARVTSLTTAAGSGSIFTFTIEAVH